MIKFKLVSNDNQISDIPHQKLKKFELKQHNG